MVGFLIRYVGGAPSNSFALPSRLSSLPFTSRAFSHHDIFVPPVSADVPGSRLSGRHPRHQPLREGGPCAVVGARHRPRGADHIAGTTRRTGLSEASAFLNDRPPLATVSARAVVNEQRGYTAFALELRPSATATTDDEAGGRTGMPITFAADDRTWSPRSRNVSVRDTAVVVVLRRAQFAALAAASRAEVRMKGWEARLPAALRGQMARIEGICTRRPLGCVPADRR